MNVKDQAAIDHVASVSKHPHAAMIVKWLITGWDVKTKIGKEVIENPTWFIDIDYELIEPEPAKPAYRVYVDREGVTFTAQRDTDGKIYQAYTDGVEWLGGWIEYDPPKKWPTPLVERIAAIDLEAAEWIVDNWANLLEDRYSGSVSKGRESKKLRKMFDWGESPQGKEYWREIAEKLGEYD